MNFQQKRNLFWTNYGKWSGWTVFLHGDRVCDLCYHSWAEQVWDRYALACICTSKDIQRDEFWAQSFQVVSRIDSTISIDNVIFRWDSKESLLLARALYAKVEITRLERMRILLSRPSVVSVDER